MAYKLRLPEYVSWIPGKITNWELWKPTLRCAICAWVAFVLLLIVPVARSMGQAAFFVIIIGVINPPSDPLAIYLDKQIGVFVFVGIAWAWATIGYRIAIAVRSNVQPLESLARENDRYPGLEASNPEIFLQYAIFDGVYLETKCSAVFAVFLFTGVTALIYMRSKLIPRFGQPFSSIFGCITLDVILTYGALIPSFDAVLGSVFVIPMAVYTAVAIIGSLVIFPESVQHQYCARYIALLDQIKDIVDLQPKMLATPPSSEEWHEYKSIKAKREALGVSYGSLDVSGDNLNREISWGRFNHEELKGLQDGVRKLIIRVGGMSYFHRTISEWLERVGQAKSRASSRAGSRASSPDRTPNGDQTPVSLSGDDNIHVSLHPEDAGDSLTPTISIQTASGTRERLRPLRHFFHPHPHSHDGHHLRPAKPVGVFESIRYMTIQDRFLVAGDERNVDDMIALLADAVNDMLEGCGAALDTMLFTFRTVNEDTLWRFRPSKTKERAYKREADLKKKDAIRARLSDAISTFRSQKRLDTLEPYRAMLEPVPGQPPPDMARLPYRGLFFVSVYSFHITEFAEALLALLDDVIVMEKKRTVSRLWFPRMTWSKMFGSAKSDANELDDEDPDTINGLTEYLSAEGVEARDPDAEPPSNYFYYVGGKVQRTVSSAFRRGDAFFAAKAGLITVLVALPQYVENTASFFYYNRGLWVIIMAQLTLQRWAGDTFLQWFYRTIATFFGAAIGACLWYISSGSGSGNAYGLAAVAAVTFPFIFFLRLHSPFLVLYIIFCVTIMLVLGYSRQDGVGGFTLANPGVGIDVAWRRFLLVLIGISIAAIFALIPPETSRHSVRRTLSRSINEIGGVHAELLGYAGRPHTQPDVVIIDNLVRINAKLRRYLTLRIDAAVYEPSLEGRWPAEKYRTIQEILLELSDLLGQLMTVYWRIGAPGLNTRWREGLVLRTRFLQPTFIGETMAIYYILTSALKTGSPLPQILPTPLVDRAFDRRYGLRVPTGSDPGASYAQKSSRPPSTVDRQTSRTQTDEKENGDPLTDNKHGRTHHKPFADRLTERHVRLDEPAADNASTSQTLDTQDMDFETISDPGYAIFVTGTLTTYDMLTRLDRLVMVVRELVGESYPVKGLDRRALFGEQTV